MHFGLDSKYSTKRSFQRCDAYLREALISMRIPKGVALIRGRRLFETQSLLEKMRYVILVLILILYYYCYISIIILVLVL